MDIQRRLKLLLRTLFIVAIMGSGHPRSLPWIRLLAPALLCALTEKMIANRASITLRTFVMDAIRTGLFQTLHIKDYRSLVVFWCDTVKYAQGEVVKIQHAYIGPICMLLVANEDRIYDSRSRRVLILDDRFTKELLIHYVTTYCMFCTIILHVFWSSLALHACNCKLLREVQ